MWLEHDSIPAWMKPDEINAILAWRTAGEHGYVSIHEAGGKLQAEVLSWAVHHALSNSLNLLYHIDGGQNRIGSPAFLKSDLNAPNAPQPEIV
jgi:hypothetical protein